MAKGVFVLMCGFGSLCVGVGLWVSLCWCVSLGVFVLVCGDGRLCVDVWLWESVDVWLWVSLCW